MQDRVPLYPGRVKLVPVAGQENTYDMVRADRPTQEGTPLNKDSLLKDATAALFGLGADAVPDDVLALLKTLVDNAQTSADGKAKIEFGSVIVPYSNISTDDVSVTLTFSSLPKVIFMSARLQSYVPSSIVYPATVAISATGTQTLACALTWGDHSLRLEKPYILFSGKRENNTMYYAAVL